MSQDENTRVLEALERLQLSLKELQDKEDPPKLSHWRTLPEAVQSAYDYIQKGAELCKATSTKYALVGKINADEGANLAVRLVIVTILFVAPPCVSHFQRHFLPNHNLEHTERTTAGL